MDMVDIAGALVSPRISAPKLLDFRRGRGIASKREQRRRQVTEYVKSLNRSVGFRKGSGKKLEIDTAAEEVVNTSENPISQKLMDFSIYKNDFLTSGSRGSRGGFNSSEIDFLY